MARGPLHGVAQDTVEGVASRSTAVDEPASRVRDARIWLAGLTLLGAVLRLSGLRAQSLWGDEVYVRHLAALPGAREIVALVAAEDVHPPGFALLVHYASKLLGDSEAMLRLPSALAGIATVPAMFLLGRSLSGTRVGLRAAALTATSWFAIYYSQECRAYSLLLLGSVVLAWLAVELVRRQAAGRDAGGYAVAMFCAAVAISYLHYFGLLFAALLGALLLARALRGRHPLRALVAVYGALALSYLPWVATLLAQYGRGEVWIAQPKLARLVKPYAVMSGDHLPWLLALLLLGAAAGALGARARGERRLVLDGAGGRVVLLAGAWAVLPVLTAFAISRLLLPVFTERNLIIAFPGVLLLAALALDAIERRAFRGIAVASVLVAALLLGDLLIARDYYTRPTKHQFREAALRAIDFAPPRSAGAMPPTEETAGAHERPLIVAEVWYGSYFDYYFRAFGSNLRVDAVPRIADARRMVASARPASVLCLEIAPRPRGKRRPSPCTFDGYREAGRARLHGWLVRHLRAR